MSNYTKATNFTAKDSLPSGNAGKIVKGAEIDTEFTAIASAISSKADLNSPALTGTPTAPTAAAGTNTTQVATTAFANALTNGSVAGAFTGLTVGAGTVSAPSITTTGDTNTGIFFPAADTIAFTEGGTEGLRLTSSGVVCVGRTTPISTETLSVNGSIRSESFVTVGNGGDTIEGGQIDLAGGTSYSAFNKLIDVYQQDLRFIGGGNWTTQIFSTTGTANLNVQGNLLFNSGYGSSEIAYGCRAWVQFDGGDGTIRASGRVSSITDDGTGNYTVNFTGSMPDANYAIASSVGTDITAGIQGAARTGTLTTTSFKLGTTNQGGTAFVDNAVVTCTVFR